MSLKRKALKGVFWSALEQVGNQLIGFIISVLLARLLLPAEFGLIAMITIFMGIGQVLINSGLTQSLIRTEDADDTDFSTVFYFNLIVSVLIYLFIVLTAPLIADFYQQPKLTAIIRVYCLVFIINAFGAIQKTRLTKLIDFKSQMIVSMPSLIISGVVGIVLALYNYGVWALVWSKIAQSVASTIQLWFWAKWRPKWKFSVEKFKNHFSFGYKLLFSTLLDAVFSNSYTVIIGKFFMPAQVGFYNKANGLQMRPVALISGIVNNITYPLLSEIQKDDQRLRDIYQRILQIVVYLLAPILTFMGVLAEPLFRMVYTEKWLPAVPYFQILCVNGILFPLHVYNIQILKVKGRSDLVLKAEIAKKLVIVVSIIVAIQFGIYGLLFASVISSLLAFFINTYASGKFVNYTTWDQSKDILPAICLAILCGIIVYATDQLLIFTPDILRIATGSLLGTLTFIGFSWLFKMEAFTELRSILKK